MPQSAFIIAGTHSGCGKTTATIALLAALSGRGLNVQAFKSGPDYIDPTYHNLAAPRQKSRNLDLWLCDEERVKYFFSRAMSRADVGVVEGVMGLFDGKIEKDLDTSTASLSKSLNLPVVLVIDASKMAQSVGALVHGFMEYDKKVRFAGVILNRVGSESHFQLLKNIIESKFPISVFGYISKDAELEIPERHLGLVPTQENRLNLEALNRAGKNIDLDLLLKKIIVRSNDFSRTNKERLKPSVRLGIARDAAFHFYYEDALEELEEEGFELVPFSPLKDREVPEKLDALYFGGGFPESFDKQLSENAVMVQSIRKWTQEKKPVFAECGGLMYLVNIGIIPGQIRMTNRLQNFGYKEVRPIQDNFLFTSKDRVRVHEFHYSVWDRPESETNFAFETNAGQNGFWNGNILASYFHCHLGAYPEVIRRWKENLLQDSR